MNIWRQRTREHMYDGLAAFSQGSNRETVLKLLTEAVACGFRCAAQYRRHHGVARQLAAVGIADQFIAYANEWLAHIGRMSARIVELGGTPELTKSKPDSLGRDASRGAHPESLIGMIRENLVAELIAADTYREIAQFLGGADAWTSRILQEILRVNEQHTQAFADLLSGLTPGARDAEASTDRRMRRLGKPARSDPVFRSMA